MNLFDFAHEHFIETKLTLQLVLTQINSKIFSKSLIIIAEFSYLMGKVMISWEFSIISILNWLYIFLNIKIEFCLQIFSFTPMYSSKWKLKVEIAILRTRSKNITLFITRFIVHREKWYLLKEYCVKEEEETHSIRTRKK